MHARKSRAKRPPLDPATLNEIGLRYVGRFATTRAKLLIYLNRKIGERGWSQDSAPDLEAMADRFVRAGYIDDAGYAVAKSRSLTARGYGMARVTQSLRAAGIAEEDAAQARDLAQQEEVAAALRFAQRKRIGPFAAEQLDPKAQQKALAAMIRAGHRFEVSKAVLKLKPGDQASLSGQFFT